MGVTGWRVLWCGGGSTCGVVSVGLSAPVLGGEAAGCLSTFGRFGRELRDLSGSLGSLHAPNASFEPTSVEFRIWRSREREIHCS